jgi:hypothetical protein
MRLDAADRCGAHHHPVAENGSTGFLWSRFQADRGARVIERPLRMERGTSYTTLTDLASSRSRKSQPRFNLSKNHSPNPRLKLSSIEQRGDNEMNPPTPDTIGPILAYRVWQVVGRSPNLGLKSWAHETVWESGTLEAACALSSHTAPDFDCSCGIYALKRRTDVSHSIYGRDVLGIVELFGRVVVATDGYRAQFARIHELWPVPRQEEVVAELAERYAARISSNLLREYRTFVGGPLHGRVLSVDEVAALGIPEDGFIYRYWDFVSMDAGPDDWVENCFYDLWPWFLCPIEATYLPDGYRFRCQGEHARSLRTAPATGAHIGWLPGRIVDPRRENGKTPQSRP